LNPSSEICRALEKPLFPNLQFNPGLFYKHWIYLSNCFLNVPFGCSITISVSFLKNLFYVIASYMCRRQYLLLHITRDTDNLEYIQKRETVSGNKKKVEGVGTFM
jgi:hypothetical protein